MEIELQDIDMYRIDELLKAVPWLASRSLDDMIYLDLVQVMRYENHRKGEYIYKHGDYADKFFIMLRGRASVQLPKAVIDERARKQQEEAFGAEPIPEDPLDSQPKLTLRLTPAQNPNNAPNIVSQVDEERIIKEELLEESIDLSPNNKDRSPKQEKTVVEKLPKEVHDEKQATPGHKPMKKKKTIK